MKKLYKIRLIIAGIIGILSILAFCKVIYPVKILDMQFAALLQRTIIDFSWIALGLLVGIIVLTLLFGRLYCSTICPFGILQEFAALVFRRKNSLQKNFKFKYIIAALTFGVLLGKLRSAQAEQAIFPLQKKPQQQRNFMEVTSKNTMI